MATRKSNDRVSQIIQKIDLQWEYRYLRLIKSEQQMKIFHLIGDFKEHCIQCVKGIVHGTGKAQFVNQLNHRYILVQPGEKMYTKDNIIFRIAKIKYNKQGKYDVDAYRNLHFQFVNNNVLNNLCITLQKQRSSFKVRVPLSCEVDYLGYRAFCQADTTFSGISSLVYGPSTKTTFKKNEAMEEILMEIGSNLNLQPYWVLNQEKQRIRIPFCLNVQVHSAYMEKYDQIRKSVNQSSYLYEQPDRKHRRDQFYLYGLQKIWPMYVQNDLDKIVGYLRPQYVLTWRQKLPNFAFTEIAEFQDYKNDLALADACKTLKEDRIVQLIARLDKCKIILTDSQSISICLHEYGINRRFLGTLTEKAKLLHVKAILKTQMLAIAMKYIFFASLEELSVKNFKQCFADFLNLIFTNDKNKESQAFYKEIVYPKVKQCYDYEFTSYPPNIPGGGLLHAVCFHFGVRIKIGDYAFFYDGDQPLRLFDSSVIVDLLAHANSFDMDTLQIKSICKSYQEKKKLVPGECEKQLEILVSINKGLNHQNTYSFGSYPEANYYTQLAQLFFRQEKYKLACEYAHLALKCIPQRHADAVKPICVLIKYQSISGQRGRSLQYYDKALSAISFHLGYNHPLQINVYNVIAMQFLRHNQIQKCQKTLRKSLEVCSQTLGYLHRTFGQILMQLGKLDALGATARLNFLSQTLMVLQTLRNDDREDDDRQEREVANQLAELQQMIGDSKNMEVFAKKAKNWKLEIIAAQRLRKYQRVMQLCNRRLQTRELEFFITKCLAAKVKLGGSLKRNKLYKIYVAVGPLVRQATKEEIAKALRDQLMTTSQLIQQTIDIILQNMVQLEEQPKLYLNIMDAVANIRDNRLGRAINNLVLIISVIGKSAAEDIIDSNSTNFTQ